MNHIIINDKTCVSIVELRSLVSRMADDSRTREDVLILYEEGDLASFVEDKGEEGSRIARALHALPPRLGDSELTQRLVAIFTGKDVDVKEPEFSDYFDIDSVWCEACGKRLHVENGEVDISEFEGKDLKCNYQLRVKKIGFEYFDMNFTCDGKPVENQGEALLASNFKVDDTHILSVSLPALKGRKVRLLCGKKVLLPIKLVVPEDITVDVKGVKFTMVKVRGGSFMMGADYDDNKAYDDEKPRHKVTLPTFYIGKTQVTHKLWVAVMGNSPSGYGSTRPMVDVSWEDCQRFISKLNEITDKKFRLPTEAEWEFAARGGNKSKGYRYSGSDTIDDVAWYAGNSNFETHEVATKAPNELGIYDMSGNVWEWCQDWYSSEYYSKSPSNNRTGPDSGSNRVRRGGSWYFNARFCRVSYRGNYLPGLRDYDLGLRLAL